MVRCRHLRSRDFVTASEEGPPAYSTTAPGKPKVFAISITMEGAGNIESVPASATCTFVGEGRANLVFTLTGVDGHPSFQGIYIQHAPHFTAHTLWPTPS